MPANSIHDLIAIRKTGPNQYESLNNPERMGNLQKISYGGCTLAIACMTGHQDVPDSHRLYAMHGSFLGPALIDRKFKCRTQSIRRTRTFTTNLVTVSQQQDSGPDRDCLVALVDFQLPEPATMLTYSRQPSMHYKPPMSNPTWPDIWAKMRAEGRMTAEQQARQQTHFDLNSRIIEARICEEGVFAQTLINTMPDTPTTQDDRHITDKVTGDWWRSKAQLKTRAEHASMLAFLMDGALSFAPLAFSATPSETAAACSTLDFAMRVFGNEFKCDDWMLREIRTQTGGVGRSYTEGTCWDQEGVMVASMTQQCILRPVKGAREVKL